MTKVAFPSPCGDVVLKFINRMWESGRHMVSVPLRGCGFEILASGSLVPRGSKQHFAARIGFSSALLRQSVLKATASGMALSAARIPPIV